jgi:hypothetical protein
MWNKIFFETYLVPNCTCRKPFVENNLGYKKKCLPE